MGEEKQIGENVAGFEGETILPLLTENTVKAMQEKHKEFVEKNPDAGLAKRQLLWHMFTGPFVNKNDPMSIFRTADGVEEAALTNTALAYSVYCTRALRNNFLINRLKMKKDFKEALHYGAINSALLMADVGYDLETNKKLSKETLGHAKIISLLDKDSDMEIITKNLGIAYKNISFYTEMKGLEYGVFTFDAVKKTLSEVYNTDGFEVTDEQSKEILGIVRRQK